jgi:hypothetical protein
MRILQSLALRIALRSLRRCIALRCAASRTILLRCASALLHSLYRNRLFSFALSSTLLALPLLSTTPLALYLMLHLTRKDAKVSSVSACVALHCAALRCIALHRAAFVLHCAALFCIALHCAALRCITLHRAALRCIALHCAIALHRDRAASRCIALRCATLCCVAMHFAALRKRYYPSLYSRNILRTRIHTKRLQGVSGERRGRCDSGARHHGRLHQGARGGGRQLQGELCFPG